MKYSMPLLLLLAARAAMAADAQAPQQVLRMDRNLTAHVVGTGPTTNVPQTESVVFDSFSGATNYLAEDRSPRTFIGMPINLDGAVGNTPAISKIVVYLAYTGTTAQTYANLRVRFALLSGWSSTSNPVFSNAAAFLQADVAGPVTLNPQSFTPITIPIDPPVALPGLTADGITVNFQGNTGAGLASSDSLTSLLRSGTHPVAVGANALANAYGYRNLIGQTNYNFAPSHASTFVLANEAMAVQLYAIPGIFTQSIENFFVNPANPTLGDGSFTAYADGGASGNPVVFSIDPASTTVCAAGGTDGATISILAVGTCTVLANQAGNATYTAAPQQSLSVEILPDPVLVQDGGFEASYAGTDWEQYSVNNDTPLSYVEGAAHTGSFFVWFGSSLAEAAYVKQAGQIAAGQKLLRFYLRWVSSVVAPPDPTALFNVRVDGNVIFSLTPATAGAYHAAYTPVTVNISAYADGHRHTLLFEYGNGDTSASTIVYLDDISILDERIFANGFQ